MRQEREQSNRKPEKQRLAGLRSRLHQILKEIFAEDHEKIEWELSLFDFVLSRRDFLKATTLSAIAVTISAGCAKKRRPENSVVPSNWEVWDEELSMPGRAVLSMHKGIDIVVDSDVIQGIASYNPIPAQGSAEAPRIVDEAVLEGVNTYIVTMADEAESSAHEDLASDRNYGLPEYLHLVNDFSLGRDFIREGQHLELYRKDTDKNEEAKTEHITLNTDKTTHFSSLRAVNGTFHNRIVDNKVTIQKMALLSGYKNFTPALMLYYQSGSLSLQLSDNTKTLEGWSHLDILAKFKEEERHLFQSIEIVEMEAYQDGLRKGMLYGTLRCDSSYNYGFVIAMNDPQQSEPTVTFFAPHFLSVHSETIENLEKDFEKNVPESRHPITSFSLFAGQRFRPFTPLVESDESHTPRMLFSFFSYDISEKTDDATETCFKGVHYDFEKYRCGGWHALENACREKWSFHKRYLLDIDTSQGGVLYLLQDFEPEVRIETHEYDGIMKKKSFRLIFDMAALNHLEVLQRVFDGDVRQMEDAYIRFVQFADDVYSILFASAYYQHRSLGVIHKHVRIREDSGDGALSVLKDVHVSKMLFGDAEHEGDTYHTLWFNRLSHGFGGLGGLVEMLGDEGKFTFHATQNREGLLRSTFQFGAGENTYKLDNLLIAFDEKRSEDGSRLQGFVQLHDRITRDATEHLPPLPVAVNVKKCFHWNAIQNDTEVLYVGHRRYLVDREKKELYPNKGIQGKQYSYFHAVRSTFDGTWSRFEELGKTTKNSRVKRDLHQVHLHTLNAYEMSVPLPEHSYVEIRFSKPLTVRIFDPAGTLETHRLPAMNALFVRPDDQGRIALEIEAGYKGEQYGGATMEYRIVDRSKLRQSRENSALCQLQESSGTYSWHSCNISFRLYQRFSSKSYKHLEYGTMHTKTAHQEMQKRVDSDYHTLIPKFAHAFEKIHDHAAPSNKLTGTAHIDLSPPITTASEILTLRMSMHDLGGWFSSVADSVEDGVESFAEDLKQIVDSLAKDIDDIIADISSSVVRAVGQLAIAIQKCWKSVKSFAQMLWHWLKSALDFNKGYEIGVELEQLMTDQLHPLHDSHPKDKKSGNLYTLLGGITSEMNKEIDHIQTEIQDAADRVFGACCNKETKDEKTHSADARKRHTDTKRSSTKHMHVFDQIQRLFRQYVLPKSSGCDYSNGTFGQMIEKNADIINNDSRKENMNEISKSAVKSFKRLAAGDSLKNSGISQTFSDMADLMIGDIAVLFKVAADMPLALLDDHALFKGCAASNQLSDLEAEVLEFLSLFLFRDKNKIKSPEDLVFFLIGYPVSILESFIGAIDKDFDVAEYLRGGGFRRDFNALGYDSEHRMFLGSPEGWEKIHFATQVTFAVLSVSQVMISLILSTKESRILKKLNPYLYLFRGMTKGPEILYYATKGKEGISRTIKSIFSMLSLWSRFGGEVMIDSEENYDYVYVGFGIGFEIAAAIMSVIDASIDKEHSQTIHDQILFDAILELVRAVGLVYIEPAKHITEKNGEELIENDYLVIALTVWVFFIIFGFAIEARLYMEDE